MKPCSFCGEAFTASNPRRKYCSKGCQTYSQFRTMVDPLFDLIARPDGATCAELAACASSLGFAADTYRHGVRAIRIIFRGNVVVVHDRKARRYRLALSRGQAETWALHLGSQRMRELDNVRQYVSDIAGAFANIPYPLAMWKIVNDDLAAAVSHFEMALVVSQELEDKTT